MQTKRDNQIVARIERLGEGKAFSAKDFLDIASRGTMIDGPRKPRAAEKSGVFSAGSMICRRSIRRWAGS
jgi:hypothetical protein